MEYLKLKRLRRSREEDAVVTGSHSANGATPMGKSAYYDDTYIRRTALQRSIPCVTTLFAAAAIAEGIREMRGTPGEITSLQEQHGLG
jgi:carbamoyl-phosphate synthase large subunit